MSTLRKWMVEEFKFIMVVVIASLPLIIFMDQFLDVQVVRDYGLLEAFGFWFCVILFKEVVVRYT